MITEFHAKDYGPLKDVSCKLTPLHAFIGPNDSGKSTLLRGIVTAVNYAAQTTPLFPFGMTGMVGVQVDEGWTFDCAFPVTGRQPHHGESAARTWISQGARLCRLEADALRRPSPLTPANEQLNWIDTRGYGLPGALDRLNNKNNKSFQAISEELASLFPTVERLQLDNVSNSEKQISIALRDGTEVGAAAVSEGMLYYLAYATIQKLGAGAVVAVEEPETGLHPSRISEVVAILRKVSAAGTQVFIATHSPLVINELQPAEVSVVTRTVEAGTRVTPIAKTPNFDRRFKSYNLGELWLAYSNGTDESPLLQGEPREFAKP